jgi:hypothetical protein
MTDDEHDLEAKRAEASFAEHRKATPPRDTPIAVLLNRLQAEYEAHEHAGDDTGVARLTVAELRVLLDNAGMVPPRAALPVDHRMHVMTAEGFVPMPPPSPASFYGAMALYRSHGNVEEHQQERMLRVPSDDQAERERAWQAKVHALENQNARLQDALDPDKTMGLCADVWDSGHAAGRRSVVPGHVERNPYRKQGEPESKQ